MSAPSTSAQKLDTRDLLRRVDLFALMANDGVELHGRGAERYGACPKCGGTDRFHVREFLAIGYFFCRQCHEDRGDAIEYLRWRHGLRFAEAIELLGKPRWRYVSKSSGPPIESPPPEAWQRQANALVETCATALFDGSDASRRALGHLTQHRGLSESTLHVHQIGFNPRGRRIEGMWCAEGITLPTRMCGTLWQVRVRKPRRLISTLAPNKYTSVLGSRAGLFNGDALSDARTAILFGGEFDSMLASQGAADGVACVTFGSESKAPTLRWQVCFAQTPNVLIGFDSDPAGEAGAEKWRMALGNKARRVRVPHGKDLTEFWQGGGDVAAWLRNIVLEDAT